jgi:hypothetical protein
MHRDHGSLLSGAAPIARRIRATLCTLVACAGLGCVKSVEPSAPLPDDTAKVPIQLSTLPGRWKGMEGPLTMDMIIVNIDSGYGPQPRWYKTYGFVKMIAAPPAVADTSEGSVDMHCPSDRTNYALTLCTGQKPALGFELPAYIDDRYFAPFVATLTAARSMEGWLYWRMRLPSGAGALDSVRLVLQKVSDDACRCGAF